MANEHYSTVGTEYRKESQRLLARVLFFSLLLLFSHLLDIKPAEFDLGGLKIAVKDAVVVRGGISLFLLYYLWSLVEASFQGSVMLPMRINQHTYRFLIGIAKRPYKNEKTKKMATRTPQQVKRHVWWSLTVYALFMTPFALTVGLLVIIALFFGAQDAFALAQFAWQRSSELVSK